MYKMYFSYLLITQLPFLDNHFSFSPKIRIFLEDARHSKVFFSVPSLLLSIFSFPKNSTFVLFFQEKKFFTDFFRLSRGCVFIDLKSNFAENATPPVARATARTSYHVTSPRASHVRATEGRRCATARLRHAWFPRTFE